MNKKQIFKNIEKQQINKSIGLNSYKYIKNIKNQYSKPYYNDLNIFTILKELLKLNKISKNQYYNSITRLNKNKPLKLKINTIIHFYLTTFKAHKTKTTISALKRQDIQNKRFILLKCNKWVSNNKGLIYPINNTFKVFLKKKAYNNLYNINTQNIITEFKIQQNNKTTKHFQGCI